MKAEIEKLYVDWEGAIESEVSPGTLIPQKGVLAGTYQKIPFSSIFGRLFTPQEQ